MKTHRPKLRTTQRPLFSCGLFRHCTQTVLSPTTSNPPPLPLSQSDPTPQPPPPPPLLSSSSDPPPPQQPDSESSSSSSTSQSFTQWRFPLPNSPISHHSHPPPLPPPESDPPPPQTHRHSYPQPPPPELFHIAELQLTSDSDSDRLNALHMLERWLVPNPPTAAAAVDGGDEGACPAAVMRGVVGYLKESSGAKPATKVLLVLCLAEVNRRVAVEAGAVGRVVEAVADLEGAAAERALAALELLCTVAEGAAEVRAHALAVPMMVEMMGKMAGRGKEYAISVLAVIYGGGGGGGEEVVVATAAPPEEVARAVALALHGDCSARGRRKGAQLLKMLQESGRLDLTQGGR
ncbi:U-box domain-containing protein 26 [Camellia lanceoleosa]|uniref:U-box domain-containing protein 26 n=1 Tax=Camellia lanceoleosa TaxID=1840588 RepID=A0ACC0G634_9ERIC|nr:U-box domain-containing protein 26 [Camellia lanceoleosa]